MTKRYLFLILILACIALGALDYFVNGYSSKLGLEANLSEFNNQTTQIISDIQTANPELKATSQNQTHNLFNKINLDKINNIQKTTEILFTKNDINFLNIYTFEFSTQQNINNYLALKKLFNNIKDDTISINETNEFGQKSFYINDAKNLTMISIIALNDKYLIGLEYSRENSETALIMIKKFFNSNN